MTSETAPSEGHDLTTGGYLFQLIDVPAPTSSRRVLSTTVTNGPRLTPKQLVYFYDPGEWEEFIREWAVGLEANYDQIKRMGGANDHGVDVAGFVTSFGFDGPWDCFQCKHYGKAITPSDAFPEVLKVFRSVIDGHYAYPRSYKFFAPKGCSKQLEQLLSSPSKLKKEFLDRFDNGKLADEWQPDYLNKIRKFAQDADFSIFDSVSLDDVVAVHKLTPHHVERFGSALPNRPPVDSPPDEVRPEESRYVGQLIEVYREKYSGEVDCESDVLTHHVARSHFRRQRESFFSTEALRSFARDSVPNGTYDALRDDVFDGVVETSEREFPNGMERLTRILEVATQLTLTGNALLDVSNTKDRKGICHQLANDDYLTWCR